MGYDGTLKFDTSIDSSGFQSGLSKLSGMASGAIKLPLLFWPVPQQR